MSEGWWFTTMEGERVWCASPERERCGGHGSQNCYCGGDLCVCGNQGTIDCMGCVDCDPEDDDYRDLSEYADEEPEGAPSQSAVQEPLLSHTPE